MATIAPRSVIGTPEPPATRLRLKDALWLLAHEVGVNTPATGRYRSADPARVLSDARAAASYGISAGKSWEYSFMIGLDGSIFTQAGEYVGSHCLNFNTRSAGVIFLNATDVPNTPAQNASWHELRAHMVAEGILSPYHAVAPHYRFRSTSCPGLRAEVPGKAWASPTKEGRLGDLIPELQASPPVTPPPVTPPTPDQEITMIALDHHPELVSTNGWTAFTWTGVELSWVVNGYADSVLRRAGVARQTVSDVELSGIIASSTTKTDAPYTLSPADKAVWDKNRR